jgi:hypothetical protein
MCGVNVKCVSLEVSDEELYLSDQLEDLGPNERIILKKGSQRHWIGGQGLDSSGSG